MQHCSLPTKFAAALAVWCGCALVLNQSAGQSPTYRVGSAAPVNPLRGADGSPRAQLNPIRFDPAVRPAQASESLPTPLRVAPADPASAQPSREQYEEIDPNMKWPAEAPMEQFHTRGRYGGEGFVAQGFAGHDHPPREPWFQHDDPNDVARHTGWGDPLTGTSWLNRPWSVGLFVGGMLADDPVADHVVADSAPIVGLRLGHDFDHYWGWEVRYAYSRVETFNAAGAPIAEPCREYFVDVALLHYPWGDSRWRPYLLGGVGFVNARYMNEAGHGIDDTALTMPIGVGLKLYNSPWFTIRFDATDTISFPGNHLDSLHNLSLAMGVEWRLGGKRPSYFPWTGNTSYW